MTTKTIYVARTGFWCSEYEYHKHHAEDFPEAMPFVVIEQPDFDADTVACRAFANSVAQFI